MTARRASHRQSQAPASFASFPRCTGSLSLGSDSLHVGFHLRITRAGMPTLRFHTMPATGADWLLTSFHARQALMPAYVLTGVTADGQAISSAFVHLTSLGIHGAVGGTRLRPVGHATHLAIGDATLQSLVPSERMRITYCLVGAQGFGVSGAMSKIGEVRFSAATELSDLARITGVLEVRRTPHIDLGATEWIAQGDALAFGLCDGLSLALGRRVAWVVRILSDSPSRHMLIRPTVATGRTAFPILHFLHLQPVLDYFGDDYLHIRERTGMVEWPHSSDQRS